MTEQAAPAGRAIWPDVVRTAGVFAVIILHIAAVPVIQFGKIPWSLWWWGNGFDSLARPCIPVFLMLSGALLLPRQDVKLGVFFRRRIIKVAVPFLAWSAIYAIWNWWFWGRPMTAGAFLHHLLAGNLDPVEVHLWFLPLILSLYLLVPVFQPFVAGAAWRTQLYFAVLWLIATLILPALQDHLGDLGYPLDSVTGYVGYFVLGGAVARHLPLRLPRAGLALAALVVAAGFAVTAWGTYVLTLGNDNSLDEYFYAYLSPSVLPMGIAAFLLLRHAGGAVQRRLAGSRFPAWLAASGQAAFGVYLVHMMLLDAAASGKLGFVWTGMSFYPLLAIPLLAAAVFAVSLGLTLVLQSTRALSWLVP